jgi:hypothetical protein
MTFMAMRVLTIVLPVGMLATTLPTQHDRQRVGEFVHGLLKRVGSRC